MSEPLVLPGDRSLWVSLTDVRKRLNVSATCVRQWAVLGRKTLKPHGRVRLRFAWSHGQRFTTAEELGRFLRLTEQPAAPVT